jgi:cystathionine beta-lyase
VGEAAEVVQVLHPALPGSPGHDHWARTCSDAAGLFAIVLDERYARPQVDALVDAFKVFRSATRGPGRRASSSPTT